MLLCIDVGNTNIVMGVYNSEELIAHWRISTDRAKMPDEYGVTLLQILDHRVILPQEIRGIAMASVVPPITEVLHEMLVEYLGIEPLVVDSGVKTGVAVRIDNPREAGADRVVNSAAAFQIYGGPACVIDLGTATTFDAISNKGEYVGGAIAPGIRLGADALFQRTAKLPNINLRAPQRAIGRNTVDAMRSGILYGYVGLVEGMVERFRAELGDDMHVIATGGLAGLIAAESKMVQTVDLWLTLKGLRIIYELNEGIS